MTAQDDIVRCPCCGNDGFVQMEDGWHCSVCDYVYGPEAPVEDAGDWWLHHNISPITDRPYEEKP